MPLDRIVLLAEFTTVNAHPMAMSLFSGHWRMESSIAPLAALTRMA